MSTFTNTVRTLALEGSKAAAGKLGTYVVEHPQQVVDTAKDLSFHARDAIFQNYYIEIDEQPSFAFRQF